MKVKGYIAMSSLEKLYENKDSASQIIFLQINQMHQPFGMQKEKDTKKRLFEIIAR